MRRVDENPLHHRYTEQTNPVVSLALRADEALCIINALTRECLFASLVLRADEPYVSLVLRADEILGIMVLRETADLYVIGAQS